MTAAICFHWDCVGSMPVGLWAQAWRRIIEPGGAEERVESRPAMSRDLVAGWK